METIYLINTFNVYFFHPRCCLFQSDLLQGDFVFLEKKTNLSLFLFFYNNLFMAVEYLSVTCPKYDV